MATGGPRPVSMEDLRPSTLDEIYGQAESVQRLRLLAAAVRRGRIVPPHLLFHGPPGVGKTTAARAFAREVLGAEWENAFNTISASDDRGITFLRERIVPLLERPALRGAPFRIFFFDEADGLDGEAQSALRPALEAPLGSCVFLLACNDLGAISDALRSRCTLLEFPSLGPDDMRRVIESAAAKIGLPTDREMVDRTVAAAAGVPRNAIRRLLEIEAGRAMTEDHVP